MLWRVELAPSTLADLKEIEKYYEEIDPDYAQALIKRLFGRLEKLERLPHRGSRVRFEELRQYLQILEKPYRIIYRVEDPEAVVYVVAILRQSQDLISGWRARAR
jgi:addiction module RelE/StbE family toxin